MQFFKITTQPVCPWSFQQEIWWICPWSFINRDGDMLLSLGAAGDMSLTFLVKRVGHWSASLLGAEETGLYLSSSPGFPRKCIVVLYRTNFIIYFMFYLASTINKAHFIFYNAVSFLSSRTIPFTSLFKFMYTLFHTWFYCNI